MWSAPGDLALTLETTKSNSIEFLSCSIYFGEAESFKVLVYLVYLLTYLFGHYNLSWPQLICGAMHQELLQLGANFGCPAFFDSHQPVWSNGGKGVLVCDNHHLAQIRRLYELDWSYPYERHDPAIEDVVF